MMTTSEGVKKTTRTRRSASVIAEVPKAEKPVFLSSNNLSELIARVRQLEGEIVGFKKEIEETHDRWLKEQAEYEKSLVEKRQDEELARKREAEEHEYQKMLTRRKEEDEFNERKASWEKELLERKEEIAADKKELSELRASVANFEITLAKAVKEAESSLEKELEAKFATERKLREQEVKSEKEILSLRIESLKAENSRQAEEIENLRRGLDEAARQVKEIAVKVIEGGVPKTSLLPQT